MVVLEVFETRDKWCPVRAFSQWEEGARCEAGMPLFRLSTGVPLTGRKLNVIVRNLLCKHIDYSFGRVTTHSFRIGLASTLGALGLSEAELKRAGRWSSRVYEIYLALPRVMRGPVAQTIGGLGKIRK